MTVLHINAAGAQFTFISISKSAAKDLLGPELKKVFTSKGSRAKLAAKITSSHYRTKAHAPFSCFDFMAQEWIVPLLIRVSVGSPKLGQRLPRSESDRPTAQIACHNPTRSVSTTEVAEAFTEKFNLASLKNASFDWETALSLALAARLAYGEAEGVTNTAEKIWGLNTCEFVEVDETQCFVATSTDAVLVAFRGTTSLGDWIANLNVLTTSRPYGTVHRGFLGAFQVVEQKLITILDQFPGRRLLLTGHSLGGALALVCAAEWHSRFDISWVHTFGQPAVGKKDFQGFLETNFGDNYYRFVNNNDIVPMVPPFFDHAGRLIHFNGDGDIESVLGSGELEALGIDLGPVPVETPMLTQTQFDLMRAQLLTESATKGGAPLPDESVERAAQEAIAVTGTEGVEGLEGWFSFPSVADHSMDVYVAEVARQAGF